MRVVGVGDGGGEGGWDQRRVIGAGVDTRFVVYVLGAGVCGGG